MNSNLNIVKIVAVLIAFFAKVYSASQPPYQVSLYVHLHPQEPPAHLCNGVVVQSSLILTTASCVHYKYFLNNSLVFPIVSNKISVISGSSTKFNKEITLQVADIIVAKNFNYTTGENDLALLRLNGILPLDSRKDISWITLEDDDKYDVPCLANFYVRNSGGAPSYIQSNQLPILDTEHCRITSDHLIERDNVICSLYYLPMDFNCNEVEALQNFNDDRGAGLVCGNKLIGLLSTFLPWQNATDCTEKHIRAYYTAIAPHIDWIFNFISEEDLNMLNKGEYISSSPYAGDTNAFVEPPVTEPETTAVYNTPANLLTTEFSAQHNKAAAFATTNCKFVSFILGIVHLLGCWL